MDMLTFSLSPMAWLLVLTLLGIIAVGAFFLATLVYERLLKTDNPKAGLFRTITFIVSFLLITGSLLLVLYFRVVAA